MRQLKAINMLALIDWKKRWEKDRLVRFCVYLRRNVYSVHYFIDYLKLAGSYNRHNDILQGYI